MLWASVSSVEEQMSYRKKNGKVVLVILFVLLFPIWFVWMQVDRARGLWPKVEEKSDDEHARSLL